MKNVAETIAAVRPTARSQGGDSGGAAASVATDAVAKARP